MKWETQRPTGQTRRRLVVLAGVVGMLALGGCTTQCARGGSMPPPPPPQAGPMPPPGGPMHGGAMPPPDPKFQAAMKECASAAGIEMPPPPSGKPGERSSAEQTPPRRPSEAQRQQIEQCLAGKGFKHPQGGPPKKGETP